MKKLLLLALALLIQTAAFAAETFSTLQESMSDKEFKETGLEKLTDKELETLNEWLRRQSSATADNSPARPVDNSPARPVEEAAIATTTADQAQDTRGLKKKPSEEETNKVIHSTLVGEFDGWDRSGTLFKLSNGMVWQQTENAKFYVKTIEDPEVTITRGFMGNWRLSVAGYNSAVRVKRIK